MLTDVVQRWRARRDTYRPIGEVIRTFDYEVAELHDDTTPKAIIVEHHYSGTYVAARRRFGLHHRGGKLVGVAVFSQPVNNKALTRTFPGRATDSVELGRFVLLDCVPANGETWFLARAFEHLRGDLIGVLSLSDPEPRTDLDGRVTFPGHIGNIYQAHNGVYLGRATTSTLRILPDGRCLSNRAMSKIRRRERGWRYAAAQLVVHGATPPPEDGDLHGWLSIWRTRLTRPLRHPGNHRYAWPIDRSARKHVVRMAEVAGGGRALPYPKFKEAA